MKEGNWNTADRICYGVLCSGIALWAIATLIEACRTRPKIQMMVLGLKEPFVKQPQAQPGPDESSADSVDPSAAE